MDFAALSEARYSLRKFSDKAVETDKLELVLKAGQNAPTAHNFQPQRFFVLQTPEALEKAGSLEKAGGLPAIEKLTMGAADLVVSSPGFMTAIGVPEIDIFSLEYLFDSFEHWEKCLDGAFGEAMREIVLDKTGNQFRIMGYWSSSVRDVYAKRPVKSPEDLKGISIRTQSSQVQQDFFKNCGAIPTTVAWGELYQALQQGVVDGAENDYTNITLKEHHKTPNGKYISETHHDFTTRLFLMNGDKYDRLTDEQKEWLNKAAQASTLEERAITYRMFGESKQKAINDGAVITEFADIDIKAFKDIATPIQDNFATRTNMQEQLNMIRSAAK